MEKYKFWKLLTDLRIEWNNIERSFGHSIIYPDAHEAFESWLEHTHGIQLIYRNGMIADEYNIVDERKHFVMMLRYT